MENNLNVIAEKKEEIMNAIQETLTALGLADEITVDRIRFVSREAVGPPKKCKVKTIRDPNTGEPKVIVVCPK